jgi:hypothetical protein
MKTESEYMPKIVSPKNSLEIRENLFVEWQPRKHTPINVKDEFVGGLDVKRIQIDDSPGWVRLYFQLPADRRTAIGVRLILEIKSQADKAQIKPMFVKSDISTAYRTVITSSPRPLLTLSSGAICELTGVFAFDIDDTSKNVDLVVNIPTGIEIVIFDASCDKFSYAKRQNVGSEKETYVFKDFNLQNIESVSSRLVGPPIYGHSVYVNNNLATGYLFCNKTEIYVSSNINNIEKVAVEASYELESFVFKNIGYALKLNDQHRLDKELKFFINIDASEPFCVRSVESGNLMTPIKKAEMPREKQANYILIWAPISVCGLTVQLEQVAKILIDKKVDFRVSYHIHPNIEHPLTNYWIEPCEIDKPKMVLYLERIFEFDRGFDAAFKVFYMNLDWLSGATLSAARVHADLVLCPTNYLLDEMTKMFHNSQVINLPWPPHLDYKLHVRSAERTEKIRVLYVGNDYDEQSRKHPFEVIEAIRSIERNDICFELKFRSPLPLDLRKELEANPRVEIIVDWPSDRRLIQEMYSRADVNLIPNACEGNGLSIIEAWAAGAVPAVLNGHPMIDATTADDSYRINCVQVGEREYAPLYATSSADILDFLNSLTHESVSEKRHAVGNLLGVLKLRQKKLEEVLLSCAKLSGIRNKADRISLEEAHLPTKDLTNQSARSGDRVKNLLFLDRKQGLYCKKPRQVDVLLTTSRRAWCLRESLDQLLAAIRMSPFTHRLFVAVDALDPGTLAFINSRSAEIDQVIWTKEQQGLPYSWNTLNNMLSNTINRSEDRPDYVCYIQDDCFIKHPSSYFETMVEISYAAMPGYLGLVSGYYTDVHPGFADFEWNGLKVIASDSIDGKNFMGTPKTLASIGPLTWRFKDGTRRGNPGPVRGSHFDLWQWNESPNSLIKQNKINLILPDLCDHIAAKGRESTWNNDTTDEAVTRRVLDKRVYLTRGGGS